MEDRDVREFLKPLEKLSGNPPAYFAQRVAARAKEARREQRKRRVWRWFATASASAAMALGLVAGGLWFNKSVHSAGVSEELVIRLAPPEERKAQIAFVELELPEGVEFFDGEDSALASERKLRLPVSAEGQGSLDAAAVAVIRSKVAGLRSVRVRYLDSENREVLASSIHFWFRKNSGKEHS